MWKIVGTQPFSGNSSRRRETLMKKATESLTQKERGREARDFVGSYGLFCTHG